MSDLEKTLTGLLSTSYPGKRVELVCYANDGSGKWRESGRRTLQEAAPTPVEEGAEKPPSEVQIRSYLRVWDQVDDATTCAHFSLPGDGGYEGLLNVGDPGLGEQDASRQDGDERPEPPDDHRWP